MITLNVGLAVNGQNPDLGFQVAKTINAIADQFGFGAIDKMAYSIKGSEPTLIIVLKGVQSPIAQTGNYWADQLQLARFDLISVVLDQDCIAVQDSNGSGILIGPKATDWGEFNPDFFQIIPEGN